MPDTKNSVMIALLPTTSDWCKIELPHLTLVYAGEVDTLRPGDFNSLAKEASSLAMVSHPLTLGVTGVEIFGDEEKVDALTFHPSQELLAMRAIVEDWNASEFPFNPHATIGPVETFRPSIVDIPSSLLFDKLMVGWGNDRLIFRLQPY